MGGVGRRGLFDLGYAFRSLRSSPVFASTAVITFALGIGVNVAVFSAVDRILFRPLPYADPDRLMFLRSCNLQTGLCGGNFPSQVAFELQNRSTTIEGLAIVGFAERFYLMNGGLNPTACRPDRSTLATLRY
jgi:hypothetical protein